MLAMQVATDNFSTGMPVIPLGSKRGWLKGAGDPCCSGVLLNVPCCKCVCDPGEGNLVVIIDYARESTSNPFTSTNVEHAPLAVHTDIVF